MKRTIGALVLAAASALGPAPIAQANGPVAKSDPGLIAALRSDRQLNRCGCILAARWLNESYPRIIVDGARWKELSHSGRTFFSVRALRIAEATFLAEFGVPDQYEQIFIVDQSGRALANYPV